MSADLVSNVGMRIRVIALVFSCVSFASAQPMLPTSRARALAQKSAAAAPEEPVKPTHFGAAGAVRNGALSTETISTCAVGRCAFLSACVA